MSYNRSLLNSIHNPLKKAQGGGSMIEGRPTVKQISQMPNKNYKPSDAVMNTKAGLAAASMIAGPLSFLPGIAGATYDVGTAARYAMDGQWENAGKDLMSAGLNILPTASVVAGIKGLAGIAKAAKAQRGIKAMQRANDLVDMSEASSITDRFTGRVQEFNRAGQETFSRRPRTAEEVRAYNQNLKGQYRTGATKEAPEYLRPFESPEFNHGGIITDPRGQWAHPGAVTRIPGSSITMKGVDYPVLGIANNGMQVMMQPGGKYSFGDASYVDEFPMMANGGQHGGLDRWFAEKWVDVKTGKACGRQEGEKRRGYPACRPSKRVSAETPKTSGELSSAEREKFKREKTSSERINYNHKRESGGLIINDTMYNLETMGSGGNTPTNPSLWSRAKSLAKQKYDVYPSAYANGWAAKWYKGHGGGWKKAEYGMQIPYMEDGGKPEWLVEAQLKAQGYSGDALHQKLSSMAEGGEPQNAGFKALPEAVQQKIISNMAYGGYMPEMAVGGWAQQAATAIAMKKAGKEPKSMADGGDPDGQMALGQIDAAIGKLQMLRKFIQPDSDLEPWVNSKLTLMDDYASAVSDYMTYNPEAQGGQEEEMQEMGNGGYTVTRSNDRKGKTHKVTGPDGTVKYFGDSKLGQHPKDKERKAAFYARHKKNLAKNPFFRAYARATWAKGGTYMAPNFYEMGGDVYENGGTPDYEPNWFSQRTSVPGQLAGAAVNMIPYLANQAYAAGKGIAADFRGEDQSWQHPAGAPTSQTISQYMINRKYSNVPKDATYEKAIKNLTPAQRSKLSMFADGGDVREVTPAEAERLRQQGYQFEIIG